MLLLHTIELSSVVRWMKICPNVLLDMRLFSQILNGVISTLATSTSSFSSSASSLSLFFLASSSFFSLFFFLSHLPQLEHGGCHVLDEAVLFDDIGLHPVPLTPY